MARATKTATTRRSAPAAEPKKKIGRPAGSKNRVASGPKSKSAAAPKKPATSRASATPAPVRMNKAELEAHVVKLERGLARAKAQNAELKKALKEAQQPGKPATAPPPAEAKTTRKKTSGTPAKRTRRTKAEMAAAAQAQEPETDSSDE